MSEAIDTLRRLYHEAGLADYIGEDVSQLAHALQAAQAAQSAGASDVEILAALFHDIGHLCDPEAPQMGGLGTLGHEEVGADFLRALGFGLEVTEPVRGHVLAKRYLVATRSDYRDRLSEASRATLEAQGGALDPDECRAFDESPEREAWLRIRSWDEAAKVPGKPVPDFEHYVPMIEAHLAEMERWQA